MHLTRDRVWTEAEEQFLANTVTSYPLAWIARRLGRSVKSVQRYQERRGMYPTTQDLITSGWAVRLTGLSPRRLTFLARVGRLPARRVPNGTWWLFEMDTLPGHEHSLRKRLDRAG